MSPASIIPFARGGSSDRDNLQALCPQCNLRKGADTDQPSGDS